VCIDIESWCGYPGNAIQISLEISCQALHQNVWCSRSEGANTVFVSNTTMPTLHISFKAKGGILGYLLLFKPHDRLCKVSGTTISKV
jgi:hypothetical protein